MLGLTLIILTDILYISICEYHSLKKPLDQSGVHVILKVSTVARDVSENMKYINLTQIQNTTEKKHKWVEKGTALRNKTLLKLEQ